MTSTPIPKINFKQVAKFWRKVARRGPDDCWYWQGGVRGEYGVFEINGVKVGAHRLAFYLGHGKSDPGELMVCHQCDHPLCCNPAHHFLGTGKVNADDMVSKGRAVDNSGEAHGQHKLTADQVEEIRSSPLRGIELARKFGVHKSAISRIRSGQRWLPGAET